MAVKLAQCYDGGAYFDRAYEITEAVRVRDRDSEKNPVALIPSYGLSVVICKC